MNSPKSKRSLHLPLISAIVGAGLVVAIFLGVKEFYPTQLRQGQRSITPRGELSVEEKSTIDLFQIAASSVVYITSVAVERDAFSMNVFEIPQGAGSGFIWDERGYIVTNFHVIQPGETLYRVSVIYKVPVDKLKQINNLADNTISVGQKIYISK